MKQISFLINSLECGGAERVMTQIASELSKTHSVTIYTLKNNKPHYKISKSVHIIPLSKTTANAGMILNFFKYLYKLKKISKNERLISFLEISNFLNILTNKKAIISSRISLDFFKNEKTIKNKIFFWLSLKLYPRAIKIITNSKENEKQIARILNISGRKVQTIYNPIDLNTIKQRKKEPITIQTKNKEVFITTGRLERIKNVDKVIKGFARIAKKDSLLIVLNDGSQRDNLKKQIQESNLEKQVIFVGKTDNVFKYLNKANYYIYASKAEGYPNALIEAVACNIPIITTDFKTGAKEVIGIEKIKRTPAFGMNGVIIAREQYEDELKKVMEHKEKLKTNPKSLEQYNITKIAKQWENIL